MNDFIPKVKRIINDPPEDWGHDDCTICEEARQIPDLAMLASAGFTKGEVVEIEDGRFCKVIVLDD